MRSIFILTLLGISLVGCSTVDIKSYDPEEEARFQKYKDDTVNMSEYDKQIYYNQNHLGVVKPDPVRLANREQKRKQN